MNEICKFSPNELCLVEIESQKPKNCREKTKASANYDVGSESKQTFTAMLVPLETNAPVYFDVEMQSSLIKVSKTQAAFPHAYCCAMARAGLEVGARVAIKRQLFNLKISI